jgi:hypothetical protein
MKLQSECKWKLACSMLLAFDDGTKGMMGETESADSHNLNLPGCDK